MKPIILRENSILVLEFPGRVSKRVRKKWGKLAREQFGCSLLILEGGTRFVGVLNRG